MVLVRRAYTWGHYKLVCSGGIQPFTTHSIWGIDTVRKFGLRILRVLNYRKKNLSRHQTGIKAGTFRNIVSTHSEIQYG
jgi:hypothetical protein